MEPGKWGFAQWGPLGARIVHCLATYHKLVLLGRAGSRETPTACPAPRNRPSSSRRVLFMRTQDLAADDMTGWRAGPPRPSQICGNF